MFNIRIKPPLLWVAGTVWPVVCTLVVLARFKVRTSSRASLSWDDWLTIPALVLIFGMAATILTGTGLGALGRPSLAAPPGIDPIDWEYREGTITRKTFYIMTILSTVTLMCIKLSAMLFYHRLFRVGVRGAQRVFYYAFITLIVCWGLGFTCAYAFNCGTHFERKWRTPRLNAKCRVPLPPILLGLTISDTIMDTVVFLYPIPFVLRLRISTIRKLALLGVFLLGAAAIAMSILRLVVMVMALNANQLDPRNGIFLSTAGDYFPFIECCFALCAICLPTLSGASKMRVTRSKTAGPESASRKAFSIFALSLKSSSSSSPSARSTATNVTLRRGSVGDEAGGAEREGDDGLDERDAPSKSNQVTRTHETI